MDPNKVHVVEAWSMLVTTKQVSIFGAHGMGYYHKCIPYYAQIASPLTDFLWKNNFHWLEQATIAFVALKKAVITMLVFIYPDF